MNYIPEGYKLTSEYSREKGHHGGCAIIVKEEFHYSERIDFKTFSDFGSIECCATLVTVSSEKKLLIICVYRPTTRPLSKIEVFFEKFNGILDQCLMENIPFIIAGDFNVNILSSTDETNIFLSILETYNLTVTNREPTRITPHSATCLDNVISNLEGTTTVQEEHMADHSGLKFIFQNGPLPLESVVKKKEDH
ncbi:uncharacterized protein LOC123314395 [Coccinella septempunctata]|uniref:uncharacterized protein LOC123309929 n=1 Tax=Coccinella septempunctata TaxID=41139 RepID=UPI001D08C237|nr:uncharacterized protein LOC123309929 [Coccinella septempunctata]XP_044755614.1 uncharacterized protein LOC123314395 [Coccinella septempunctata]